VARCVVANIGNLVLVLVDFQDKLVQCKLLVYILGILPKISIWNGDCSVSYPKY